MLRKIHNEEILKMRWACEENNGQLLENAGGSFLWETLNWQPEGQCSPGRGKLPQAHSAPNTIKPANWGTADQVTNAWCDTEIYYKKYMFGLRSFLAHTAPKILEMS